LTSWAEATTHHELGIALGFALEVAGLQATSSSAKHTAGELRSHCCGELFLSMWLIGMALEVLGAKWKQKRLDGSEAVPGVFGVV
jgi:hypothetical protein